jgi:peptidoglycan/LPS O-acetylase OafA/YrhL
VAVAAPLASLLVASLLHRVVETPAIRLGRGVAAWLDRRAPHRAVLAPSR